MEQVTAASLSHVEFKLEFGSRETAHRSHFGTITLSWILIGSFYESLSSVRAGLYKMLKDCWLLRRWLWTFHSILTRKRYQRSNPWVRAEIFLSFKISSQVLCLTLNPSFMKYWGSLLFYLIGHRQLSLGLEISEADCPPALWNNIVSCETPFGFETNDNDELNKH